MRLGLLTAPFPETPLSDVVDWTAANGFESIEIACWPRTTGSTRRYAGTSHIDVANLSAGQARDLRAEIEAYDDFCDFRQREAERRGIDPATAGRADWLEARREELQDRMHRRRNRGSGMGASYGRSSGYGGTGRSYGGANCWRPGVFRLR